MSPAAATTRGLTHNEWHVLRRQSDGAWATISVCLDPRKADDVVRRSHDVLPARPVRVQVRSVTVPDQTAVPKANMVAATRFARHVLKGNGYL